MISNLWINKVSNVAFVAALPNPAAADDVPAAAVVDAGGADAQLLPVDVAAVEDDEEGDLALRHHRRPQYTSSGYYNNRPSTYNTGYGNNNNYYGQQQYNHQQYRPSSNYNTGYNTGNRYPAAGYGNTHHHGYSSSLGWREGEKQPTAQDADDAASSIPLAAAPAIGTDGETIKFD